MSYEHINLHNILDNIQIELSKDCKFPFHLVSYFANKALSEFLFVNQKQIKTAMVGTRFNILVITDQRVSYLYDDNYKYQNNPFIKTNKINKKNEHFISECSFDNLQDIKDQLLKLLKNVNEQKYKAGHNYLIILNVWKREIYLFSKKLFIRSYKNSNELYFKEFIMQNIFKSKNLNSNIDYSSYESYYYLNYLFCYRNCDENNCYASFQFKSHFIPYNPELFLDITKIVYKKEQYKKWSKHSNLSKIPLNKIYIPNKSYNNFLEIFEVTNFELLNKNQKYLVISQYLRNIANNSNFESSILEIIHIYIEKHKSSNT